MTPPLLGARGLEARRGSTFALRVPSLDLRGGEVLAVIGPNGAGKSTLLKTLALLEPPDRGEIRFEGEVVSGRRRQLLAFRRRMAVVFQEPLLCDTTVAGNVEMGLRIRGVRERGERVRPWLDRLGITPLADRHARALSGGEAQRTSLARAFVLDPEVLFLDEPLAALDAPTRDALLADLRRLLSETRTAALFVTHDRDEALALGDRVAVLIGGMIRQLGSPESVFSKPVDEEVARFVGVETVLPGTVLSAAEGLAAVQVAGVRIEVVGAATAGARVLVCVRPHDVALARTDSVPSSVRNKLEGVVTAVVSLGFVYRVVLDCGVPIVALVTKQSAAELKLQEGQRMIATFKATAAHLLPRT